MKHLACLILFIATTAAAAPPPNIVLIVIDDMGWADIGYHSDDILSPTLDALARTGVELDQHYVQPQCTPTRVALMTGRYPSRFGGHCTTASNVQSFPIGTPTLASALRDVGYDTAITGKWHMGSKPQWGPKHYGFNHSHGSFAGGVGMFDHRYRLNTPYAKTWHRNHKYIEEKGHAYDLVTDQAVEWIGKTLKEPFFCYVPYHGVHTPLVEPDERINAQTQTTGDRRIMAAAVQHLDQQIARIIKAIEERGARDNTMVIIFSDNGGFPNYRSNGSFPKPDPNLKNFSSNQPLRGQKSQSWEGGIRVPALVNWPGRIKPRKVTTPMHCVDWLPTLCKLAGSGFGVNVPDQPPFDGRDIWPLLTGEQHGYDQPREFYWTWGNDANCALRHGDWKMVIPNRNAKPRLFNLARDPNERDDLASMEPDKLKDLQSRLDTQRARDAKGKAPWLD